MLDSDAVLQELTALQKAKKTPRTKAQGLRIPVSKAVVICAFVSVLVVGTHWSSPHLLGGVLYLLGAFLVAIATVGRLWCSMYICGYKKATLVTIGPYSLCRHPLYVFSFLGALGLSLATETLTLPLVVAAVFLFSYPAVINSEEKALARIHGEEYEAYCRRTPKIIPSLRGFNEPETYEVKPKIFRRAVLDVMWLVCMLGILEFIKALHERGVLPTLMRLY